jgi:hypothetical protein
MLSVVRPFRVSYKPRDLGDRLIPCDPPIERHDFTLPNPKNQLLQASHFHPSSCFSPRLIIYLHGNSGCRADIRPLVVPFLKQKFDLLCFDFAGSGVSEGEWVSLGVS